MSLVTEDGTGLATAESYLSVADADTYWSNRGDSTWAAGTTAGKEEALRRATQYLDAEFIWIGAIASTTQALGWPRAGACDHEGRDLSDMVPVLVENACAELAKEALSGALLTVEGRDDRAKRVKAGSVEVEYMNGAGSQKAYKLASLILAPVIEYRRSGASVPVRLA